MIKISFKSTEAKSLSFVNFPQGDKYYQRLACKPLDELDNLLVFKKIFFALLQIAAYGILLFGVFSVFSDLFGYKGYFQLIRDMSGGKKTGGVILSIPVIILALVAVMYIFSIINNRSRKLLQKKFKGLLDFFFGHLFPMVFIIIGEILVVVFIVLFFGQLLSAISNCPVYNPMTFLFDDLYRAFIMITQLILFPLVLLDIDVDVLGFISFNNSSLGVSFVGLNGFNSTLLFLGNSLAVLVITYLFVEIYKYLYQLILNLIEFLPKFGIPVAVRHRNENSAGTPEKIVESKDVDLNEI